MKNRKNRPAQGICS